MLPPPESIPGNNVQFPPNAAPPESIPGNNVQFPPNAAPPSLNATLGIMFRFPPRTVTITLSSVRVTVNHSLSLATV